MRTITRRTPRRLTRPELTRLANAQMARGRETARLFSTNPTAEDADDDDELGPPRPDIAGIDLVQAHWLAELCAMCPLWIKKASISDMQMKVELSSPRYITPFFTFIKEYSHGKFVKCLELSAIDLLGQVDPSEARFELFYVMSSTIYWNTLRVHVRILEEQHVDSVTPLFGGSDWQERECFDMFGIFFRGHPDLRRILTDYGFMGHPLRKDFPLTGYTEIRYDDTLNRIVYEPLEITQEMRNFDFLNPWAADDLKKRRDPHDQMEGVFKRHTERQRQA